MTLNPAFREYVIPRGPSGEWAIFVINPARGYFSVVSDHGNYAFLWTHPGGEFRNFLAKLELDYVYGKLTHTQNVFDAAGSKKAILEGLEEIETAMTRPQGWVDRERDELAMNDEGDFGIWLSQTEMEDPHEYYRTMKDPGCWAFVQRLFPQFQKMLREELEKEKADGSAKE